MGHNYERERLLRQKRKEAGQCFACGSMLSKDWVFRLCPDCRKRHNASTRKTRDQRIQNGLCPLCGKNPSRGAGSSCESCGESASKSTQKHRRRREGAGQCRDCGKTSPEVTESLQAVICDVMFVILNGPRDTIWAIANYGLRSAIN